jgi:hypothetical protein
MNKREKREIALNMTVLMTTIMNKNLNSDVK